MDGGWDAFYATFKAARELPPETPIVVPLGVLLGYWEVCMGESVGPEDETVVAQVQALLSAAGP